MKRLIIRGTCFSAPLLLVFLVLELLVRRIPNPYSVKDAAVAQRGRTVTTVVLGSSHAYYGIDTDALPGALSLANPSQTLDLDEWLLRKYIDRLPGLRNVVVAVTYPSLNARLATGPEAWRMKNYRIYFGYPQYFPLKYDFEATSDLEAAHKRVKAYYLTRKYTLPCTATGFGADFTLARRNRDWQADGPVAALRHTGPADPALVAGNQAILRRIITLCLARGVRPVLVTTPVWETYARNLDARQLATVVGTCAGLSRQFGVPYLDLLRDPRFGADDFYNPDHLDTAGARKLAGILAGELR